MAEFIEEDDDPQGEITPTLAELIRIATEAHGLRMRVCLPAEVIKYYKDEQKVDVQLFFEQKYRGKIKPAPVIYSVPVAFYRAGSAIVAMPIKKGNSVTLFCADRSLQRWLASGARGHPEDTRNHHISDAIAYPGLYPFSKAVKINNDDDIIIRNEGPKNKLEIRIKPNGHVQILNGTDELLKTLDDAIQIIRDAVIYTCQGPMKLKHSKFGSVHSRLKTFREK